MDFEPLYDEHVGPMIGQVAVLTGDVASAQDAVQEAWVRAWLRWDRVRDYDHPVAWVRRVAMNLAVSRWRRVRRLVSAEGRLDDLVVDDPDGARLVDLRRAIAALPVASRRVVVLHHLVGLSVEEVAAELGIPTGTVKSRLSRSRDRLAVALRTVETTSPEEPSHHV